MFKENPAHLSRVFFMSIIKLEQLIMK